MIYLEQRNPTVEYTLNIDLHSHWKSHAGMLDSNKSCAEYTDSEIAECVNHVVNTLQYNGVTVLGYVPQWYKDQNSNRTQMFLIVNIMMPNDSSIYDKLYQVSQTLCQDCITVRCSKTIGIVRGFLCGANTLPYGHFNPANFSTGIEQCSK